MYPRSVLLYRSFLCTLVPVLGTVVLFCTFVPASGGPGNVRRNHLFGNHHLGKTPNTLGTDGSLKGPNLEKNEFRLKFQSRPSEFPAKKKLGPWWVAHLKVSVSLDHVNAGGKF